MQIFTLKKTYPIVILMVLFSISYIIKLSGALINSTPSMPEGIYIRSFGEIKRGDIVAACLADPYKTIGLEQLYIGRGMKCKGSEPVIKQVIALPGDSVTLEKNYIVVNSSRLFFKTLDKDDKGRSLIKYPRGVYLNTKGYWLIGTMTPNSWDSRYWGPISKSQIISKLILM
jgi:conjugative transfer signal peptidase TraF